MANMQRQPTPRGRWQLNWDSETVQYTTLEGSGWWLDLRTMRTALDALELLHAAQAKSFTSARDICLLADVLRIYLRGRF